MTGKSLVLPYFMTYLLFLAKKDTKTFGQFRKK